MSPTPTRRLTLVPSGLACRSLTLTPNLTLTLTLTLTLALTLTLTLSLTLALALTLTLTLPLALTEHRWRRGGRRRQHGGRLTHCTLTLPLTKTGAQSVT